MQPMELNSIIKIRLHYDLTQKLVSVMATNTPLYSKRMINPNIILNFKNLRSKNLKTVLIFRIYLNHPWTSLQTSVILLRKLRMSLVMIPFMDQTFQLKSLSLILKTMILFHAINLKNLNPIFRYQIINIQLLV